MREEAPDQPEPHPANVPTPKAMSNANLTIAILLTLGAGVIGASLPWLVQLMYTGAAWGALGMPAGWTITFVMALPFVVIYVVWAWGLVSSWKDLARDWRPLVRHSHWVMGVALLVAWKAAEPVFWH